MSQQQTAAIQCPRCGQLVSTLTHVRHNHQSDWLCAQCITAIMQPTPPPTHCSACHGGPTLLMRIGMRWLCWKCLLSGIFEVEQ